MKIMLCQNILSLIILSLSWVCKGQVITVASDQESLDQTLNSKSFEENPILSPDGNRLYFTRAGHAGNVGGLADKGDVWYAARLENGSWGPAQNLGTPINSNDKNTVIGFLDGGRAILLTQQNFGDNQSDQGFAISIKEGELWSKPRTISIPYFKSQSEFQSATISSDGSVMVFSLMTFGTYGVEDLYFTKLKADGSWSDLRNLGPTINTRFQEMTPFISPDNQTIYFASNGYQGEGSLDIYYSQRLDDSWRHWSTPVNLGQKVNSIGSESGFKFLSENKLAILVSTQNSDGYGDLKKVDISFPQDFVAEVGPAVNHPLISKLAALDTVLSTIDIVSIERPGNNFSGKLTDRKTGNIIEGQLFLVSEFDSLTINSTEDGYAAILIEADYTMVVTASDYLEYDTAFTITEGNKFSRNFSLQPLEVGNTITLDHVLFERGTTTLIGGSEQGLETVYHMLRDNPSIEIEIAGHTDNQGNFKLNVKLSQDRVDKVVDYLKERGINKKRLSGKGWGPMKPIAKNNTEESRRLNRRVEFTIVKK